ncbi:MAG TPA: DUF6526 family protein [Puia sp.]|nr:DUF6526 family protein [Puia sp.]
MPGQNFKNHIRYYIPHHLIFYPLLLIALITSVVAYNYHPEQQEIWIAIIAIFIFIGWLSYMMRQHYALGNQNRIVRLELRFRYFTITGKRLELYESKLSFKQLAALRFASDVELNTLVDRAVNENLTPKQIKKMIVDWLPDHMRV